MDDILTSVEILGIPLLLQFSTERIFYLFAGAFDMGGEQRERRVCTSPACIKAAARVLARLDPSVDPCSDFYQFSCGRFLETGSVPDDSSQLSTLQEMQDEMFQITRSLLRFCFDFLLYFYLLTWFCQEIENNENPDEVSLTI